MRLAICLLLLLSVGCCDNAGAPPVRTDQTGPATILMGDLNALCPDYARPVTQPLTLAGTVTSSDEADNFYRSLTLQDDTGAVELMCGIGYLYRDFPPGTRLSIRLQGLAIGKRQGITQIGFMPATGNYAVDYIASKALLDSYVTRGATETPPAPQRLTIPELTPALCGTLLTIENLTLQGDERTWTGYRTFADPDGHTIRTHTSAYARYALSEIPENALSLTGILQATSADHYLLKMRDESDCAR